MINLVRKATDFFIKPFESKTRRFYSCQGNLNEKKKTSTGFYKSIFQTSRTRCFEYVFTQTFYKSSVKSSYRRLTETSPSVLFETCMRRLLDISYQMSKRRLDQNVYETSRQDVL